MEDLLTGRVGSSVTYPVAGNHRCRVNISHLFSWNVVSQKALWGQDFLLRVPARNVKGPGWGRMFLEEVRVTVFLNRKIPQHRFHM